MDIGSTSDSDRNNCTTHGRKFEFFCKTHNLPGCAKCMFLTHKSCQDVSEISNDIETTRQKLSMIRRSLSEEKDKLTERRGRVKTVYTKAKDSIDSLKRSLIAKIGDGISGCNELALSKKKEAEETTTSKLKDLENFDSEVKAVMDNLDICETSLNCHGIRDCYNKANKYEIIGRERIQTAVVVNDFDFVQSETSKDLLRKPISFGLVTEKTFKAKEADNCSAEFAPNTGLVKENKLVQTTDTNACADECNEILEQLSHNFQNQKEWKRSCNVFW